MSNDSRDGNSVSWLFSGLLTIVFITLKICKIINWSWLWVLSPIWISIALYLLGLLLAIIIEFILG